MLRSEATKKDRALSGRTTPQDQPVWKIALDDPQATNSRPLTLLIDKQPRVSEIRSGVG